MVARRLAKSAKTQVSGYKLDELAAAVMYFHALEAFVNTIGESQYPELWKNKKKGIKGQECYRGVIGHLRFLCDEAGVPTESPMFLRIKSLKNYRDSIAHSRRREYVAEISERDYPYNTMPNPLIDEIPDLAQADHDVRGIRDLILSGLGSKGLDAIAFCGIVSESSSL